MFAATQPTNPIKRSLSGNTVEPDAKKTKTSLLTIEHDHTSCQHTLEMDQKLKSIDDHLELYYLFTSCNHVNEKYKIKAEWDVVYAENSSQLKLVYEQCQSHQNFDKFRDLKILAAVKQSKIPPVNLPAEYNRQQMKAVARAWQSEYKGDYDDTFIQTIQEMNETRNRSHTYASYASIIQSSGTGKSRLVDQTARTIFCIPFNLRASIETESTFPPPDDHILHFFLSPVDGGEAAESEDLTLERNDRFFAVLFTKVAETINDIKKRQQVQFTKSEDVAQWWRKYLSEDNNRALLYQAVRKEALSQTETLRSRDALQRLLDTLKSLSPPEEFNDSPVGSPKSDSPINKKIRILMYFDEAHTLNVRCTQNQDSSLSHHHLLTKTLNNFRSFPIFSVFLSTNSNMSILSPPQRLHPSHRISGSNIDSLQAPYTELPFDCSPGIKQAFKRGKLSISEINQFDWMCKFGRALFWSIQSNMESFPAIDLAYAKLSCGDLHSETFHLAALTTRLDLQLDITRAEGLAEEAKLVESHMRIAFYAPEHRQYLWSGTPSEPILAEAAVKCMAQLRKSERDNFAAAPLQLGFTTEKTAKSQPDTIAQHLARFLKKGIADKGERGELVARLLVTEAFDHAAQVEGVDHACRDAPSQGTGAVTVAQFFKSLLGEEKADQVLGMRADNMGANDETTFRDVFDKSAIRFTHFIRGGDDWTNTSEAAFGGLGRGYAVICRPGTKGIDLYIPVVKDKYQHLSEENTTVILIQVKDTQKSHSVNSVVTTAEKLRFFPEESNPRAYIFIVMVLGVQPPKQPAYHFAIERPAKGTSPAAPSTPQKSRNKAQDFCTPSKVTTPQAGTKSKVRGKHPRYSIIITGCSSSTYAVVNDKNVYAELLGSRSLLREVPRQKRKNMSAVKRLKAMWIRGSDCWDWMDSEFLCPGSDKEEICEEIREKLTIGSDYVDE